MARFMDFLILVTLCFYLANVAIEDGSSASLLVPQPLMRSTAAGAGPDENASPTRTVNEAENLINLLPASMELPAKGIDKEYYFFSTRMAEVRLRKVPGDVSYRNDRDLVTTSEIEQSQYSLRNNNARDFGLQEQRSFRWASAAADFQ